MNYSYSLKQKSESLQIFWEITVKLLVISGLILFSLSLYFIALYTSGDDIYGIWLLLIGWIGIVFFQLSWFANLLNLLALLLLSTKPKISLLLTLLAFLLASQTFWFVEIPVGLHQEKIYIKELGLGFYLWYSANGIFILAALIETLRKKSKR